MVEASAPAGPNADQITYWNGRAGDVWVTLRARIDGLFAPLTRTVTDSTAARPGEAVLDIGCGCGTTVLDLASRVAPGGRVVGVDISKPMLGVAGERVAAAGLSSVELRLADAATAPLEPAGFDLIFSRFGVMFFEDPAAAFHNIRNALAPAGRLRFACWQPMAANPWFAVALGAVKPLMPPQPPADPNAPGPFAFADPDRVRRILTEAGFTDIVIEPLTTTMHLSGPNDIDAAIDLVTKVGPAARLLAEAEPDVKIAALAAIRAALLPHDGPGGLDLGGAIWLVSAQG